MHLLFLVVEGKLHGALSLAVLNCGGSHELQDLSVLSSRYVLDPELEERAFCQRLAMASPWARRPSSGTNHSGQGKAGFR